MVEKFLRVLFRGRFVGLILALTLLYMLVVTKSIQDSNHRVYEPVNAKALKESPLRFAKVSASLGVDFKHKYYFPNPHLPREYLPLLSMYPSVAVIDINDDGYQDFFLSRPIGGNALYINQQGQGFVDQSNEYGLRHLRGDYGISRAVFVDVNQDDLPDLVIARFGRHSVYLNQGPGRKFKEMESPFGGYASNAVAVNFFDFNRDGKMDLVFGNYWSDRDISQYIPLPPNLRSSRVQQPGGRNVVFEGLGSGQFKLREDLAFEKQAHTNSIGISDINDDLWPDVFVANDYSSDEMYFNSQGRSFYDVTEEMIPRRFHGYNGMNSEFADFSQKGQLDLYVTNVYRPPFNHFHNILWEKQIDGSFKEVSKEKGVARCGWSWSAKAGDFDNDGQLDLISVNGRSRSFESKMENAHSYWYQRVTAGNIPRFIKKYRPRTDFEGFSGMHLSSFERTCVFRQQDGHFYDVSLSSGIDDFEDGYGLATLDFDNDGRLDILVTNLNGPALLYRNISQTLGDWVGVRLIGKAGRVIPIGAKAYASLSNGRTIVKELYPANGFNSQSDARLHFGLQKGVTLDRLMVLWPNGQRETFPNLPLHRYSDIREGEGFVEKVSQSH